MFDITTLFIKLFNLSLSAGWIVLFVVLLRLVLKKAPKWINCLWWLLVGLRLIFPFSVESVFSLIPSSEVVSPDIIYSASPSVSTGIPAFNSVINPIIESTFTPDPSYSVNPLQVVAIIGSYVWLIGLAVMLIYTVVCYVMLRRKMRFAVKTEGNIYESENVESPFILGVIRPKIYLPFGLEESSREHILSHEKAHLKRKDHLIKPIAFLLLSVYWFNPLMWVAYVLLCRDIELACDEKAVKEMEKDQRKEYSLALLQSSVHRRMVAACPLAFGEVGVKQRVKSVMNYKKPAFWVIVVALIASVVASVCLLTNPIESDSIETGRYVTEQWLYRERATDYTTENTYILFEDELMYVLPDGEGISLGDIKKANISAEEIAGYAKMPGAWLVDYDLRGITASYIVSTSEEPIMSGAYILVKTESGDVLLGEIKEDTENENETVKLVSLQNLKFKENESLVIRESISETSERDFQIEVSLMNQLDPPEDTLPDMPYTAVSFHVLGEQCLRTEKGTIERYAVAFARYRYTYEDGQLFESGEANKAILEFTIDSDGTYVLRDCKEFILDGTEAYFEREWDMLSSEADYDTQQLSDTLTYECRVKAMNYYHIAHWTYAPMLSASWYYVCPITFSVDYDKIVVECSDGDLVRTGKTYEYDTKMTYDNTETVSWCPNRYGNASTSADSAEISFTLYKNGKKIYKDTIKIKEQKNFTTTNGTIYVLEMSDNRELFMAEGPTVRSGVWTNEIRFYKERVLETESDRVILSVHYLLPTEIETLNEIMDTANWINADYASRVQLRLDGKFNLNDKTVFFSDEMNVLYAPPYYAEIESEDMAFIMSLQGWREYKSEMEVLFAKLSLELTSDYFEFMIHPLSSRVYYGNFEETENSIVIKDDETEAFFTFRKSDGKLIFDADKSSEIPQYNGVETLKDGAVFMQ